MDRERRRAGRVQDTQLGGVYLDLARRQARVLHPGRPAPNRSTHLDDPFGADVLGRSVCRRRRLRMGNHLHQPGAVPHVEEGHSPVVSAAVHPSRKKDLPADVGRLELAALVIPVHAASDLIKGAARSGGIGRRCGVPRELSVRAPPPPDGSSH